MTIEERLAMLEAQVADLTAQLARAKPGQVHSMAHTHRCPACGGTTLLHVRHVKEWSPGGIVELGLQLEKPSRWKLPRPVGPLEAYACRTCRLVELHAITLDEIVPDGENVVELTAPPEPPPDGVYR